MSTAYIYHFGCRLNLYESNSLLSGLSDNNIIPVDKDQIENADFIIINTCTVTNRADQKNRSAIRQAHRKNPNAKIIVTGCYATTDAHEIKKLPGVYAVVSNQNKANIPNLISGLVPSLVKSSNQNKQIEYDPLNKKWEVDGQFGYKLQSRSRTSRAYLKIQDGCNKSCSYCKIPFARGPGRSRDFNQTIEEAKKLIALGFQEITLTGVNIGWYHTRAQETKEKDFYDLLTTLLNLKGDFYIRISSIEPGDVNERLAHLLQHPKMAKFLHVPLQSGSKRILKKMRRGYTPLLYQKKIKKVQALNPDIHIGTDIIVGFPGESAQDFKNTWDICKEIGFANIHIFPYSKRNNTPIVKELALTVDDKLSIKEVPQHITRKRINRLKALQKELYKQYIQRTSNKSFRSIVEKSIEKSVKKEINIDKALPKTPEKTSEIIYVVTENYVKLSLNRYDIIENGLPCPQKGDMVYVSY